MMKSKQDATYPVANFLQVAIEIDSLHDEQEILLHNPLAYSAKERRTKLDCNAALRDKLEATFGKMWDCLSENQQLVVYRKLTDRGLAYVADGV